MTSTSRLENLHARLQGPNAREPAYRLHDAALPFTPDTEGLKVRLPQLPQGEGPYVLPIAGPNMTGM